MMKSPSRPAGESPLVPSETRGGTHGYLPDQLDLLRTCILWGCGISPGGRLGKVSNCPQHGPAAGNRDTHGNRSPAGGQPWAVDATLNGSSISALNELVAAMMQGDGEKID
jgi:hypothetical protein